MLLPLDFGSYDSMKSVPAIISKGFRYEKVYQNMFLSNSWGVTLECAPCNACKPSCKLFLNIVSFLT